MTILTVDIGNTHTVAGIRNGGELLCRWRFNTRGAETVDELAAKMTVLMSSAGFLLHETEDCIISSVVPPALKLWKDFAGKYIDRPAICVNEHLHEIMEIRYGRPYEVGADRIVNAVAAWEMFRSAVIVVDFGTAVTFDCISEKREYLGGVIAPGPLLAASSLATGTSRLPVVDLEPPEGGIIAQDTVSAIKSGIIYGFAGLTDGILKRLVRSFSSSPMLVATGGLAQVIIPHCNEIENIVPDLTLDGLSIIYDMLKNRE